MIKLSMININIIKIYVKKESIKKIIKVNETQAKYGFLKKLQILQ